MAFQIENNQASAQQNANWKASAFMNLYLPDSVTGKPKKFGAIPLRDTNVAEKGLIDWLKADPSRVQKVLAALTADFRLADEKSQVGFKLD